MKATMRSPCHAVECLRRQPRPVRISDNRVKPMLMIQQASVKPGIERKSRPGAVPMMMARESRMLPRDITRVEGEAPG